MMIRNLIIVGFLLAFSLSIHAQVAKDYAKLKKALLVKFDNYPAGKFESFGKGVKVRFKPSGNQIALTFDACGGPGRNRYDTALIDYLRKENIPATLFMTGLWIDEHLEISRQLAGDSLFEIENHGLMHKPCSIEGASRYKVMGTTNLSEVIDEVALNAQKITQLVNRPPQYYRAATATSDQACGAVVSALGGSIVNFDVLSGDAMAGTKTDVIAGNILRKVRPGSIVIMHMNHPEWNGLEALQKAIPILRKRGYSFVLLRKQKLLE